MPRLFMNFYLKFHFSQVFYDIGNLIRNEGGCWSGITPYVKRPLLISSALHSFPCLPLPDCFLPLWRKKANLTPSLRLESSILIHSDSTPKWIYPGIFSLRKMCLFLQGVLELTARKSKSSPWISFSWSDQAHIPHLIHHPFGPITTWNHYLMRTDRTVNLILGERAIIFTSKLPFWK